LYIEAKGVEGEGRRLVCVNVEKYMTFSATRASKCSNRCTANELRLKRLEVNVVDRNDVLSVGHADPSCEH